MREINNSWKPKSRQVSSSTNKPEPESRRFTNGYCGQIIVFPWPIIYNKLVFCVYKARVTYRAHYRAEEDRTRGAPVVTRGSRPWNLATHGKHEPKPQSVSDRGLCRIPVSVNVEENALCWREKAVWCLTCYRHCENIAIDIRYWFQIFLW